MAQCAGFKQKHALLKLGLPLRGILTLFFLFVKSINGVSSSELSTGAVLFNSHGLSLRDLSSGSLVPYSASYLSGSVMVLRVGRFGFMAVNKLDEDMDVKYSEREV